MRFSLAPFLRYDGGYGPDVELVHVCACLCVCTYVSPQNYRRKLRWLRVAHRIVGGSGGGGGFLCLVGRTDGRAVGRSVGLLVRSIRSLRVIALVFAAYTIYHTRASNLGA